MSKEYPHGRVVVEKTTVTIYVTPEHIAVGLRPSQKLNKCPIALALEGHGLNVSTCKFADKNAVFAFMEAFDKQLPVEPFSFEVITFEAPDA